METMILDATCGSKSIYNDWNDCDVDSWIGIDIRKGDFSYKNESDWTKHVIIIKPTVLASLEYLPFKEKSFNVVIYDPPYSTIHWQWYEQKYGKAWGNKEATQKTIKANMEFNRVLIDGGLLILKTMPNEFERLKTLFTNFKFILPIFINRLRGGFKNPKVKTGALWAMGVKT